MLPWFWIGLLAFFASSPAQAKTVRYELVATEATVNVSGKAPVDFVLLVNGQLPAPTLAFNEGDDAEIQVTNRIPGQELSIHWHGILLPSGMDGVPYVNTPPIRSGETFSFRFPIRQSGTYWYHTHTNVQEQKGVYGALVIQPKQKTIPVDKEAVVVLSDWADEDALSILANLRKDGEYYLYKKNSVRSWLGAIQAGGLKTYLENEWTRMGGMDYSDVGYDAFLINGQRNSQVLEAHPGDRVRIRIINAAASTYFHVALGQAPLEVIASDGVDTTPRRAQELLIGMAETYDLLFTVPEHKNYELKATAQDGTGTTSTWIGMGSKVTAPERPKPGLYDPMSHGGAAGHGGHAEHETNAAASPNAHAGHEAHAAEHVDPHAGHDRAASDPHAGHTMPRGDPVIPSLTVDDLKSLEPSAFSKGIPIQDVRLVLDGDMERYVWHINGKAMFEDRSIIIKEGDVIRFTLVNETMMHHPMHLHGHFFRVLNANGDSSPWKHTVDVPPHSTRTLEFLANEPGEWMLHCHNLYHMKTGMARVVKYSSFTPTPEMAMLQMHDPHLHDHTYAYGMLEAATNHAQAKFRVNQTWNEIDLRLETRKDYSWDLEGDLLYRRWQSNYLNLILGGTSFDHESRAVLGVGYLLPMLIESQLLIDHEGKLRLDLDKRFQWSSRIFTEADVAFRQDHSTEWEISLMYADRWAWSAGLKFTGESTGVGVQYQF